MVIIKDDFPLWEVHIKKKNSIRRKTARTLLIKDYANSLTNRGLVCLYNGQETFLESGLII